MTAADYEWGTWPPSDIERQVRAEATASEATLARVLDSLDDVIAYAARHGGLAPVGQLRAILAEVAS